MSEKRQIHVRLSVDDICALDRVKRATRRSAQSLCEEWIQEGMAVALALAEANTLADRAAHRARDRNLARLKALRERIANTRAPTDKGGA